MVVGFTTACAISVYHHKNCEFESHSWQGVLNTTLCDKVCQWLAAGRWYSPDFPVSSTNETDGDDIAEILLKVALNTRPPYLYENYKRLNRSFLYWFTSHQKIISIHYLLYISGKLWLLFSYLLKDWYNKICVMQVLLFAWWCLTPISTIFQLYRSGKFFWWKKPEDSEKTLTCRKSLTNCITPRLDRDLNSQHQWW